MLQKLTSLLFILGCATILTGQNQLDRYINMAVRNNHSLKEAELQVKRQSVHIQEAKAQRLPTLGFQSRYTRSGGGRAIEFETGDLVNPAYANLNLLNQVNASTPGYPNIPDYPVIPNAAFNFLRQEEQETKFSLVLPLFNKTIQHNQLLQEELLDIEAVRLDIATINLIHEVKTAYYQYLMADQAIGIFDTSMALVKENIRTTKSLYKNDRVTKDQLLAAEAQLKSVEYQKEEAINNSRSAKAYFNYLLNRKYDAPILKDGLEEPQAELIPVEQAIAKALGTRRELKQLEAAIDITDRQIALNKSKFAPTLSLVGDYGIQGTQYSFNSDADFYMGSAVLSWNILNKSDRLKTEGIEIDKQQRKIQSADLEKQIGLQVINAYNAIQTSLKNLEFVKAEKIAAAEAFNLVQKKYRLGRANQIEFTDARVRLTSANQKAIVTNFEYWLRKADLEYAMGYSRGVN